MFLNVIAPVGKLGYGVVGYNILKALSQRGHPVSFWPIGDVDWSDGTDYASIINGARKNSEMFNNEAPCLRIWHQFSMDMFVGKGPKIGFPIFELDKFDEKEKHHLNGLDRIFVTSKWAKEVIEKNGINVRTSVIPLGVDETIFFKDEKARSDTYWTKDKTIFLNIGKWEVRKGHNELIEAFCKAFNPEDKVELWMMNHNPFIGMENERWKSLYIESPMGSNIRILPRVNSHTELRALYNKADVGVWPSHAEGWNLEPLEMMACGGHVIATNYSGHTEYINKYNSMLIEPNGTELAHDGRWFFGQGNWCKFNVQELADTMKDAHRLKMLGKLGINVAGMKTASELTWTNTAKIIEAAL